MLIQQGHDRLRYCRDEGSSSARIVLVGEAPGRTEAELLRPFVGWSGNLLKRWWDSLFPAPSPLIPSPHPSHPQTIDRRDIYITNLVPYLPSSMESIPADELLHWRNELWKRITQNTPQSVVIVPVGNFASWACCGKGKIPQFRKSVPSEDQIGITQLRGSIYTSLSLPGITPSERRWKVIPSLHPAFVLRSGEGGAPGRTNSIKEKHCIRDWRRILYESTFPEIREPQRRGIIDPYEAEVAGWVEREVEADPGRPIVCDIETWGSTLSCVGFSASSDSSICIPTASKRQFATFAPYIQRILAGANPIIGQNFFSYDRYWLQWYGFCVNNFIWDTMPMHHTIDAPDQHDLAYMCSYYLPFYRYWKDEAKEAEEIVKYAKDQEQLWRYNNIDCWNTYELFGYLYAELQMEGMLDFYHNHYQTLFDPIIDTMLHGIRIDDAERKRLQTQFTSECATIRETLQRIAGTDLYAKKDFSRLKLLSFFKDGLGLPVQYKMTKRKDGSKQKSESLDNTALAKYAHKYPDKCEKIVELIVTHRGKAKVLNTWLDKKKLDKDGRVRATFSFAPETGRLNSRSNPRRSGFNLQNTKHETRAMYLPDIYIRNDDIREVGLFCEVDLSQVEDRFAKMYCHCTGQALHMVEIANRHPSVYDAHRHNAALVFGVPEPEVTKDQRFLGKIVVHGATRQMSGKKLSDKLLADHDIVKSPKECQAMINAFHKEVPEISQLYWPWVRKQLMDHRVLVNSWGRKWKFNGSLDDEVYRKGYSFYPQSENADLLNQWGYVPFWRWLVSKGNRRSKIHIQRHDAIIFSSPFDEMYDNFRFLLDHLERPITIFGYQVVVPATVKVGSNDKNGIEFKILPERVEFEERIRQFVMENWESFQK